MITIAKMTVLEMLRRRFVITALLATLVCAGLTAWGFHALHSINPRGGRHLTDLDIRGIAAILVPLIAYACSFILAFAAIMLWSSMLSTEIESGVLLPILSRPISRSAVVAGKAIGLGVVLCAYTGLFGMLEFAIVDWMTGYLPPHPYAAVFALMGVAMVMMTLTLAIATRLQALATSIVCVVGFGIEWLVGIVASIGLAYHNETLIRLGAVAQLVLPTDALWRVSVYQLQPVIMSARFAQGGWPGPFLVTSPPPTIMVVWSIMWVAIVLAIALRSFSTRDV